MKAKCIMIQGTGSSVGKSVITAGLCRVFVQDGYRVAPFKSQNMALNSFITREGKEMGRAQVVQAEAAGIEPSVEMNPILLKPTTDRKSQVIINGEVYKNMSAAEYHVFKPELAEMVKATYERLAGKNDIVVIEGAGSPAEINLRDKDIVNMGMAEMADAPVLLVGDIDKGGVFASLAGTMLLLTEAERKRVKGVIINKFRGDIEILKPGLQMLEDIIHIPVVGVLPYTKLNIEDEDSLAEKFSQLRKGDKGDIDVAVVRLPHISNFTDFNALEQLQGVRVRYIEQAAEIGEPDLILLPGTKNTMEDLLHIRRNGLEEEIKRLNKKGTVVFGICGGYQMLGMEIHDPYKTESELLKMEGLGLLNTRTVFRQKKITTQVEASVSEDGGILQGLKGMKLKGYEIHMGTTEYMEGCIPYLSSPEVLNENPAANEEPGINANSVTEANPAVETNPVIAANQVIDSVLNESPGIDGPPVLDEYPAIEAIPALTAGVRNGAGTVFGTYIHGIFDNITFTGRLINNLRSMKGMSRVQGQEQEFKDFREFKEQQYDKLADMLRENLDMRKIYEIVGI